MFTKDSCVLDENKKIKIEGLTKLQILDVVLSLNEAKYRADQIYKWVYTKDAESIDDFSDVSKNFRGVLKKYLEFTRIIPKETIRSNSDSSIKVLWNLEDGEHIESVILKDKERITGCISTQVGCRMGCKFCNTAQMGLIRNLMPSEIVRQIIELNRICQNNFSKDLSNLVFMGMGEPIDNIDNLIQSLNIILDGDGLGFSHRKVTVSTCGVINGLDKIFEMDKPVNLAVSINATTDDVRNKIMPVNNKFPIEQLLNYLKTVPLQKRKRVTFEYVLLKDVNDSLEDAKRLGKMIKKIPSKVNLIVYNETEGGRFKKTDYNKVLAFQKILTDMNITAFIRKSLGSDIKGACGQLRGEYNKKE